MSVFAHKAIIYPVKRLLERLSCALQPNFLQNLDAF